MPKVLVALPTYNNQIDARLSLFLYGARLDGLTIDVQTKQLSALCWSFNMFLANALNNKTYDYFLLIHADIVPYAPTSWIRKLIAEAENNRADLLSAVSPIKNTQGLTSTALQSAEHPTPRRLTLRELEQLPQTFKASDVAKVYGWSEHNALELLINTGCLLLDLRRKRETFERMHFRTHDDIVKRDGKFVATFTPEDWDFSRQAQAQGLNVAATKAVKLIHNGATDYDAGKVWGDLEHDTLENSGV